MQATRHGPQGMTSWSTSIFIELIRAASAPDVADRIKGMSLANCKFANVVVLFYDKLVAQLDCSTPEDGTRVVLEELPRSTSGSWAKAAPAKVSVAARLRTRLRIPCPDFVVFLPQGLYQSPIRDSKRNSLSIVAARATTSPMMQSVGPSSCARIACRSIVPKVPTMRRSRSVVPFSISAIGVDDGRPCWVSWRAIAGKPSAAI